MNDAIATRLAELGVELPAARVPRHAYLPSTRFGDLLFLSGKTPREGGELVATGRLGAELDLPAGRAVARIAAISALASLEAEVGLQNVRRILKLTAYVASADGFFEQPAVADGASELLAGALGEAGRHARTAVGVAYLPGNAPVEIDLILEVR